jgi:hypothetical protein
VPAGNGRHELRGDPQHLVLGAAQSAPVEIGRAAPSGVKDRDLGVDHSDLRLDQRPFRLDRGQIIGRRPVLVVEAGPHDVVVHRGVSPSGCDHAPTGTRRGSSPDRGRATW